MVDLVILVLYHFSDVELSITHLANIASLQALTFRELLGLVSAIRAKCFGAKLTIFYIFEVFVLVVATCAFTTFALLCDALRT